jgi:hypothetical protein
LRLTSVLIRSMRPASVMVHPSLAETAIIGRMGHS